ncbi:MobA-like NTP transferase domain containing protein, partial [Thermodesulfobacteriota bacterium]
LGENNLVVLGFSPEDRKQYGLLEIEGDSVRRIIEWKYWREYPEHEQRLLTICNSGIYAAHKKELIRYLDILGERPHVVLKERDGEMIKIEEYFITDLIELMQHDGIKVGYALVEDEHEVMGIDDRQSLLKAQKLFELASRKSVPRGDSE